MKNISLAIVVAALVAVAGCSKDDRTPERKQLDADMAGLKATADKASAKFGETVRDLGKQLDETSSDLGKQLDKTSRDIDRQLDSAKKDINKQLDGAADAIKGLKFK